MDEAQRRKTRLSQLLDLAQTYKGWTRKELAKALGRDPTKLVPGSGVPKLDFVIDLAGVLDWTVDDVVAHLWGSDPGEKERIDENDFESLDEAAREAHRQGRYHEMIELAGRALDVASTPEERARACQREAGGWDGLGRHQKVLESIQRGLRQGPVSAEFRRMLQVNLANAYYSLWSLVEARAIAADLIRWFDVEPPRTTRDRKTQAFAYYVAGHTHRRLVQAEPERALDLARMAQQRLDTAVRLFEDLAVEFDNESYEGIANTCRGGLVEVEVVLSEREADDAIAELLAGLDVTGECSDEIERPVGDRLESLGWWCIFGCNIALRHLTDERELQQCMAVFTNKADEIADELDNWSMRERVFTMEHSRWERAVGCTGFDIPRVVDDEDVRVIAGTMARFPTFQRTGWEILRSARVIRAN